MSKQHKFEPAPNLPLCCPFCDERSVRAGSNADIIVMDNYIYYPRRCIMGHEFYSVEWVPDNYGKALDMLEHEMERRTELRVKEAEQAKFRMHEHMKKMAKKSLKVRRKKAIKRRNEVNDWRKYTVVKKAGQKSYTRKGSAYQKRLMVRVMNKRHRLAEQERKKRRDAYLKGGLRNIGQ